MNPSRPLSVLATILSLAGVSAIDPALSGQVARADYSAPSSGPGSATYLTATLGYDPGLVSQSLPGALGTDSGSLLAALNQRRSQLGLPSLQAEEQLTAAADYLLLDEMKLKFSAPYAYLADGTTSVLPQKIATDFGSPAADVQASQFSNGSFAYMGTDWVRLVSAWWAYNGAIRILVSDPKTTSVGLALVTFGSDANGHPLMRWSLLAGQEAATPTSTPAPTATAVPLTVPAPSSAPTPQPTPRPTPSPAPPQSPVILYDLDADGRVTLTDVVLAVRALNGLPNAVARTLWPASGNPGISGVRQVIWACSHSG